MAIIRVEHICVYVVTSPLIAKTLAEIRKRDRASKLLQFATIPTYAIITRVEYINRRVSVFH